MKAFVEDSIELASVNMVSLAQKAGGSSASRESIGGVIYIVVEGCSQDDLEAALEDQELLAETRATAAAVAAAQTQAAWESAKAVLDAHQALEAVNCTFEIILPVLATINRVLLALNAGEAPEPDDELALVEAQVDLEPIAGMFSDPATSSDLTVLDKQGYISEMRARAAALRQQVSGQ